MTSQFEDFKVGDLVWAKMKGYPPWPGLITDPPASVNVPKNKKGGFCIYFFGSKNYSWIDISNLLEYEAYKDNLSKAGKSPLFKEAVEAIQDYSINGGNIEQAQKADEAFDKLFNSTPKQNTQPTSDKTNASNSSDVAEHEGDTDIKDEEEKSSGSQSPTNEFKTSKRIRKATPKLKENLENGSASKKIKPNTKKVSVATKVDTPKTGKKGAHIICTRDSVKDPGDGFKPTTAKIGFLGLGNIGFALAKKLVGSGHKVTVWNRSLEKCELFDDGETSMAFTPSEVVNACDIIFCCMKDSDVVRHVLHGNGGVLCQINSKKSYVEMTSIDIQTSCEIQDAIKSRGGKYLDAMTLGSRTDAETGSMVFLTSGDQSVYEQCLSCFDVMGKKTVFFGDAGNAVKMHTIINILSGVVTASFAEALVLAERAGVSMPDAMEIIQATSLSSEFLRNRIGAIFQPATERNLFPLQNLQKNLRGVVTLSEHLEEPVPLTATVNEMFKNAKKFGYASSDAALVYIRSKF